MKVFKFGGASICDTDKIKNVASILQNFNKEKILVVISAMGKTTNALEKVAEAFYSGDKDNALSLFHDIKKNHLDTAASLSGTPVTELADIFTEIEWLLHDNPVREYDYYYDQVVCSGELMSTAIVNHYLRSIGQNCCWVDVRDIFKTDDTYRDAIIQWEETSERIQKNVLPLFNQYNIVITQGFIGSTDENESTTLGREGSDYSAAVFANIMNADSQTIWKDVDGVMNADPRKFPDARIIRQLSFKEAVEMTYYGASVIHPKTIQPLQNKNIPLHVRCFLAPNAEGTIISNDIQAEALPPIIVVKENQALLQLSSKDFSFVEDKLVAYLHELFTEVRIRPNITQNGAISLLCGFDDRPDKIEKLAIAASGSFDVSVERNLELMTIRHYNAEIINELTKGRKCLLEQKTNDTIQMILR